VTERPSVKIEFLPSLPARIKQLTAIWKEEQSSWGLLRGLSFRGREEVISRNEKRKESTL